MGSIFSGLGAWVIATIESLGYVGVAALIALENVFPPIPSEVILPLAGFLVGQGRLGFLFVLLAATVGAEIGALALYLIGRWLSRERLERTVQRHGKWVFLKEEDIARAHDWFDRHGGKAVFIGRLIPVVRSLISIPAGVARMHLGQFLAYSAGGSLLWNSALIGLGWWLGAEWETIGPYVQYFQYVVFAVIGALVARFIWQRLGSTRRQGG